MRGGNHGKIKFECSVDPQTADYLIMLRAVSDEKALIYFDRSGRAGARVRSYITEVVETYVPEVFRRTFGLTVVEFRKQFPRPRVKQLPSIARELVRRKEQGDESFYRRNVAQVRSSTPAGA